LLFEPVEPGRLGPPPIVLLARIDDQVEEILSFLVGEVLPAAVARRPVHTASRLSPSSGYDGSAAAPAASRIVAVQSIVIAAWSVTRPGGTVPVHRTIAGTRVPPSWRNIFWNENGQLYE
jgi:hypothetical protein